MYYSEMKQAINLLANIILDNKIYFQTDIKFDKCMQIEENNNVALCLDNYQINPIFIL